MSNLRKVQTYRFSPKKESLLEGHALMMLEAYFIDAKRGVFKNSEIALNVTEFVGSLPVHCLAKNGI